jgi:hypothetical protein
MHFLTNYTFHFFQVGGHTGSVMLDCVSSNLFCFRQILDILYVVCDEFVYPKHNMCVFTTQTYGCVDWFGVCWLPPISFVNVAVCLKCEL